MSRIFARITLTAAGVALAAGAVVPAASAATPPTHGKTQHVTVIKPDGDSWSGIVEDAPKGLRLVINKRGVTPGYTVIWG